MTRNMRNRRGTAKSPETRMDTGTAELRNTRNRKTHLSIEKNNFEKKNPYKEKCANLFRSSAGALKPA